MQNDKLLLSDLPTVIRNGSLEQEFKVDEGYSVFFEKGDHLILVMGFGTDKAGFRFRHEKIMATVPVIHEFKHYHKNGGKSWTRRPGINHYVVIPREKILVVREKGFSYVKTEINGVKVTLNAGGGGGGGQWTDYVSTLIDTGVGCPISQFKKILDAAIRKEIELPERTRFTPEEFESWQLLAVQKAGQKRLGKLIDNGKKPEILLQEGYNPPEGRADRTERTRKGKLTSIIVDAGERFMYRVEPSQIDWLQTLRNNDIWEELTADITEISTVSSIANKLT